MVQKAFKTGIRYPSGLLQSRNLGYDFIVYFDAFSRLITAGTTTTTTVQGPPGSIGGSLARGIMKFNAFRSLPGLSSGNHRACSSSCIRPSPFPFYGRPRQIPTALSTTFSTYRYSKDERTILITAAPLMLQPTTSSPS
ncbi:hypothetical protein FRC19_005666 [Serendipita sp. 401]|nr:hypothetical protein FRC19_005666 [Serendipita sp. 401]